MLSSFYKIENTFKTSLGLRSILIFKNHLNLQDKTNLSISAFGWVPPDEIISLGLSCVKNYLW